ncbi:MAG: hypothetical protein DRO40_04355 [Thermoprotei archaeon]|nr:MAG: hypothetical protein DRO40_04355 [Thermoprotei archaeon]
MLVLCNPLNPLFEGFRIELESNVPRNKNVGFMERLKIHKRYADYSSTCEVYSINIDMGWSLRKITDFYEFIVALLSLDKRF